MALAVTEWRLGAARSVLICGEWLPLIVSGEHASGHELAKPCAPFEALPRQMRNAEVRRDSAAVLAIRGFSPESRQ